MKKIALAVVLACTLIPAASNAQVYVHIGPPVAVVEHPGPPPGRDFVWVSGYHRWDGNEATLYIRWEGETHRDHRDFRDRPRDEQQQYWNWRHHSNDRDRDHDHDHD